ncbi:hypothetical protein SAMN05216532_7939 [Streptomyces sp. 2231.1]|nr:hypothetical protein [Streptomyces sp. 2231.1]SEE36646.1 hypothetical protein SAMN05216532_7939 [Streptomyces sp. 2231.1]
MSDIVINNDKPIVVGTSKVVEPTPSFTIALSSGYSTADPSRYDAYPFLYRGGITTAADTGENFIGPNGYGCYETDSKHARCEGSLYIDPHPSQEHVDSNSDATTWKVGVSLKLWKADGGLKTGEPETRSQAAQLKRAAKATANASPEPVTKGTDTFKTVKKATTSSTGGLKATVTASVDGSYRWVYHGNSTTGVATSPADYVDVR